MIPSRSTKRDTSPRCEKDSFLNTAPNSIKPVDIKHADIVAEFIYYLIDELAAGKGPSLDQVSKDTEVVLKNDHVFGFVSFEDTSPTGLIMLNECAAIYAGGIFGEISELYVAPKLRSRGIAGALIQEAVDFARSRKWNRLEVGAPNQPEWKRTFDFYVRAGFDEVGPRLRKVF
jgi:GNAT superfamily N-acetyltransferase